jgi:thioredoxin 1
VRDVTEESFEQDVLKAVRPVIVDFWAPWCGPCKAVEPVLEELAAAYEGQVEVVRLNIDQAHGTAGRYGILSIPTAILFAGGKPRETVVGARSRSHYEQAWANWLKQAAPPS